MAWAIRVHAIVQLLRSPGSQFDRSRERAGSKTDGVFVRSDVLQVWRFHSARLLGIPGEGTATGDRAHGSGSMLCWAHGNRASSLDLATPIRFTFPRALAGMLGSSGENVSETKPARDEVLQGATGGCVPRPTRLPAPSGDSWRRFSRARSSASPPDFRVSCALQLSGLSAGTAPAAGARDRIGGLRQAGRIEPRIDSIVRVEAGRLRSRLRQYCKTEDRSDPILIEYPNLKAFRICVC